MACKSFILKTDLIQQAGREQCLIFQSLFTGVVSSVWNKPAWKSNSTTTNRTNLISHVATTHTLTCDASSSSCQDSSFQNYDIKFTASARGLKTTPYSDGSRTEGYLFFWEAQVKAIILAELVSWPMYLRLVFLFFNVFCIPLAYISGILQLVL